MIDVLKNIAKGQDSRGNPSVTLVACILATLGATLCLVLGGNTIFGFTIAGLSGLEYAAILTAIGTGWTVREVAAKKVGQ